MRQRNLEIKKISRWSWRRVRVLLSMVIVLLAASACQTDAVTDPPPTPAVLEVQVSAALRVLAPQFQACAAELENTGIVLLDSAAQIADNPSPRLTLRWGAHPTPAGYAAIIGQEELLVVMHPDNPLTSIALADIRAIYHGALSEWPDAVPAQAIEAWSYPPGVDAVVVFENMVLDGQTVDPRAAGIIPDPTAMLEVIAANPSAIGFVPARWINAQVKAVTIADLPAEAMTAPILSISAAEPRGSQKNWLICLQETLQ